MVYSLAFAALSTAAGACGSAFSADPGASPGSTSGTSSTGGTGGGGGSVASTATGTGAGGSGGSVPTCNDADADGETDCAGDCDDTDPQSHTGAPEVCGDLVDQSCDGVPDEEASCHGLGTFVSAVHGDDDAAGTQAAPVKSIAKGIEHALLIGGGADVYVAEGQYAESVALSEDVSLFGGYEDVGWTHDPSAHHTVILCPEFVCVTAETGITRATVFDGFRVVGKKGAPVGPPGNVAVQLHGGCPVLSNNRILGGKVTGGDGSFGGSFGLQIFGTQSDPKGPLIQNNDIAGGDSPVLSEGILLSDPTTTAEIRNNTIVGGAAQTSHGFSAWSSAASTLLDGNVIRAGDSTSGGSYAVLIGGSITVNGNKIHTGPENLPKCTLLNSAWCGGLVSLSATAVITNNVIFGTDSLLSTAVLLIEVASPAGAVVLNGNLLDGAGPILPSAGSKSAAVVFQSPFVGPDSSAAFGSIRNNILLGGRAERRFGVYEDDVGGQTASPLTWKNNVVFFRPPQAIDAVYRHWDGSVGTSYADFSMIPPLNGFMPNGIINPGVDPTFHLMPGSPCINAGTGMEAPLTDMDGEPRPSPGGAVDIGPDEVQGS